MRIAFDCQGVLIADGPTPEIIETRTKGFIMPDMVKHLVAGGAEVYCISASPEGHPLTYETLVKLLRGIPLHGIYPAFIKPGETPYNVGLVKAAVMEEIGCYVLFDDLPDVCQAVRDSGKIAINYTVNWEGNCH
jgi:hypothetical protein